jgi:hypothetical protein
MSRTPTEKAKIQANSLPEIRKAWWQATVDLSDDAECQRIDGTLRDGNLLNAFVLWCLMRPRAERDRIAREGLRAFDFLRQRDEPIRVVLE